MAEILLRAKPHWMDSFTQAEIDAMSVGERQSRDARIQIGDIVVVRPDGWTWGSEECLPTFLIVKLPGVEVDTIKHLEEALTTMVDDKQVLLKRRKWMAPRNWMDAKIANGQSVVTITLNAQKQAMLESLIEKLS